MRIKGIFDAKICVVKGKCGMKLSVCNIAWTAEHDAKMYGKMKELGMEGIEIAPTRIFPDVPYEHLSGAHLFAEQLKKEYGLSVASMQSIWRNTFINLNRFFQSKIIMVFSHDRKLHALCYIETDRSFWSFLFWLSGKNRKSFCI